MGRLVTFDRTSSPSRCWTCGSSGPRWNARLRLDVGAVVRHAPVLAQVLGPGLDEEPLDDLLEVGRVLGDTPGVGAVPPPLLCEPIEGAQEGRAILGPDSVSDRNDHGAAVVGDGLGREWLGPVHRWHQVAFA